MSPRPATHSAPVSQGSCQPAKGPCEDWLARASPARGGETLQSNPPDSILTPYLPPCGPHRPRRLAAETPCGPVAAAAAACEQAPRSEVAPGHGERPPQLPAGLGVRGVRQPPGGHQGRPRRPCGRLAACAVVWVRGMGCGRARLLAVACSGWRAATPRPHRPLPGAVRCTLRALRRARLRLFQKHLRAARGHGHGHHGGRGGGRVRCAPASRRAPSQRPVHVLASTEQLRPPSLLLWAVVGASCWWLLACACTMAGMQCPS